MMQTYIEIQLDGETHRITAAPEQSILDAAEEAGVTIPTSCRVGSCATCRARLIEGEVEMETNMALDDDDIAAGYILVCQSTPLCSHIRLVFEDE